jgi:hypothetical protein
MTLEKRCGYWLLAMLCASLTACANRAPLMAPVEKAPVAKADEAMVVFMRTSMVGGMVSASVFDVTEAGPAKLVGIVNYGTKVAYPTKPGEYTFMVVGESADFMKASVAPGKTYYALVTPRIGMWKARFSFRPIRASEIGGREFADWDSGTRFVSLAPQAQGWAASNAASISAKRSEYWADWSAKPADERASQTLNLEDGR